MDADWIKLFRKSMQSQVFKNEGLWKVWCWCLMKAAYKEKWVQVAVGKGTTEVKLNPGQFIFGRNSATEELNMNGTTIWKRVHKLKNMGNCDIQSDSHYSIITIINWDIYQTENIKSDSQSDNQVTAECLPSDTNKNVKNVKNIYKRDKSLFVSTSEEVRLSEYLFGKILSNNPQAKPPNIQVWAKQVDLMIRIDKRTPEDIQAVIDWCQEDDFWKVNILSTAKLRQKFDQLYMKMTAVRRPSNANVKADSNGRPNVYLQYLESRTEPEPN